MIRRACSFESSLVTHTVNAFLHKNVTYEHEGFNEMSSWTDYAPEWQLWIRFAGPRYENQQQQRRTYNAKESKTIFCE